MDSKQLTDYSERLEATGLSFAVTKSSDGGANMSHLEELPWDVVIVKLLSLTGWRIVDGDVIASLEPVVAPSRRDHLRLVP